MIADVETKKISNNISKSILLILPPAHPPVWSEYQELALQTY